MNVNASIFREYDIRGIAGENFSEKQIQEYEKYYGKFPGITLDKKTAEAIGKAYGTIIRRGGGRDIVIGSEIRPYGEELKEAFIKGALSTGCNICDCGPAVTPLIYFANAYGTFDGGVNVAGSHNIYFFNGFKLMKRDNEHISGLELQELRKLIEKEDYIEEAKGRYSKVDFAEPYKEYIADNISMERKLKIVVDSGNGTAGIFGPDILKATGIEVIELYSEPDATFPNHVPDPEQPQNLKALAEKVIEVKADAGVAFDADADRAGFVDENGQFVKSELIMLLFSKEILSRVSDKKIIYDVSSSSLLEDYIKDFGGEPIMLKTGHSVFSRALRDDPDIIFGGESSGHYYFTENYFKIDDGIWAAAKLLEIFSRQQVPFSRLFSQFPRFVSTPTIKLPCDDDKKFDIVSKISQNLVTKYESITIDGVRINVGEGGWGLIRASNTSPNITVKIEAESEEEILKIKNILADELEKYSEIGDKLNRNEVASLTGRLGWV